MKKIVMIMTLLAVAAIPAQVSAAEVTTNYSEFHKKIVHSIPPQQENKKSEVYQPNKDNEFILKYVVDDIEAAPWNNGGKRKYLK